MKKLKFLKSLKFRIFILMMILGLLPGAALQMGLLKIYENKAVSNRRIDILSQAKILGTQIVTYDYLNNTSLDVINAQLELLS